MPSPLSISGEELPEICNVYAYLVGIAVTGSLKTSHLLCESELRLTDVRPELSTKSLRERFPYIAREIDLQFPGTPMDDILAYTPERRPLSVIRCDRQGIQLKNVAPTSEGSGPIMLWAIDANGARGHFVVALSFRTRVGAPGHWTKAPTLSQLGFSVAGTFDSSSLLVTALEGISRDEIATLVSCRRIWNDVREKEFFRCPALLSMQLEEIVHGSFDLSLEERSRTNQYVDYGAYSASDLGIFASFLLRGRDLIARRGVVW